MCQQPLIESPMVLSLISGLAGSLIGGAIAAFGAIKAVTYMEYIRRSEILKVMLRELFVRIDTGKIPYAGSAIYDSPSLDAAVTDIIPYLHVKCKKRVFTDAWNTYRWNEDKSDKPKEYSISGTDDVKIVNKLIKERLSHLISILE